MCGRFPIEANLELILASFDAEPPIGFEYEPRYDVKPGERIAALRAKPESSKRELIYLRWGLLPSWAPDPKGARQPFNARVESLQTNPMYEGLLERRRCAIPATGYFEWKTDDDKRKRKYLVSLKSGETFAFAGIWDRWSGGGATIESAAVVTTTPNPFAACLHDRMPVMLIGSEIDAWLDPSIDDPKVLVPLLAARGEAEIVIQRVKNDGDDSPESVVPIGPPETRESLSASTSDQLRLF